MFDYEVKGILKNILKELQLQTKIMLDLYDRKDDQKERMGEVNKSMAILKAEFDKQPFLRQGEVGKMMNGLFKTMGGIK